MAPRPPQSSLPSSLSTPQLGLVSQGRFLAVSGSPSYPPVTGNNASGGLAPFRSFRNLLSFGPGKNTPGSSSGSSGSTAVTRSSIGGLRRPQNGDRIVSAPQLPPSKRQEDPPILSIELSHPVDEPSFDTRELRDRLGVEPGTPDSVAPSPISSSSSFHIPEQPLIISSDLSTIIEAETSRISSHLPSLDDLQGARRRVSPSTLASRPSSSDMQDSSFLDLSTTNVRKEVLAALSASDQKHEGWLNGVVVEDVEPPTNETHETPTDSSVTFNLSALDKDLADLLKSKRPAHIQAAALAGINAASPPLLTPPLTDGQRGSRTPSPRMTLQELGSPIRTPATVPNSPVSSTRYSKACSSLSRTTSLARPISSKPPPSTLARLGRSNSEKPSFFENRHPLPSPTKTEPPGRQSLQLPVTRTSPLLQEDTLPARPTSSDGTDPERRRTAISRLATPSRYLAAANNARASQRQPPPTTTSPSWGGGENTSPRSSGYGVTSTRRIDGHRLSFDKGDRRPLVRGRDRSTSLTESVPYNPSGLRSHELMGPRTAKVFAAAGLLDEDRESAGPSASRPGTRFGFSSSTRSDRDYRSQYAPSRAGFSEMGSSTSWGRRSGSISHTGTSSEMYSALGTPDSIMTPRTTYSVASTAPTSISVASSVQKHLETEIQRLEEKHSTETGALLNALADSQRTTRILREENTQLRDRVQSLQDEVAEVQEALHKFQFHTPPFATSTLPRTNPYRIAGRQPAEPARRPIPHSRLQSLLQPNPNDNNDNDQDKKLDIDLRRNPMPTTMPTMPMPTSSTLSPYSSHAHEPQQRRYSSSSSVFASLPSNMPMLLQEDGGSFAASPPSPVRQSLYSGHYRNASSGGNISPTTANFSMVTGSPRSLDLRSEHERLLGDMPSLDLHVEDYESHVFHDA
ncbi:hypothetical protein BDY19DRAFT_996649 [Irpex rosettiformis]|uniref:Uncharacterized protein n=1 Tax=Irpex rosettiformis TaxID=378272 RepID=A0ACB8TTX5_9APHY|nr:hypothetical protein BDY19DRAFT_996649 [Irpex rosettiformis]